MQINTTVSAWQCQWGRNSVICRSAKEEGSERKHGGGERSTALSLHPFPSSPSSTGDVLGNRASLWGEAWWMPFPRWMERIALSCTTLPGESYTALGDSSIDYFFPSMDVPCKHTYISSLQCTCAPLTHMQTQWVRWSAPRAYSLLYNQILTSTSSWASSNHKADASDGLLNRDEWRDEGINKW